VDELGPARPQPIADEPADQADAVVGVADHQRAHGRDGTDHDARRRN
jgi:hypothetical protein